MLTENTSCRSSVRNINLATILMSATDKAVQPNWLLARTIMLYLLTYLIHFLAVVLTMHVFVIVVEIHGTLFLNQCLMLWYSGEKLSQDVAAV